MLVFVHRATWFSESACGVVLSCLLWFSRHLHVEVDVDSHWSRFVFMMLTWCMVGEFETCCGVLVSCATSHTNAVYVHVYICMERCRCDNAMWANLWCVTCVGEFVFVTRRQLRRCICCLCIFARFKTCLQTHVYMMSTDWVFKVLCCVYWCWESAICLNSGGGYTCA